MSRNRPMSRSRAMSMVGRAVAAVLAAAFAVGALAGCAPGGGDRPSVYVTTNILGDVVSEIAGDHLDIVTLMAPGADPHSFELSAQQAAGLRDAELIVANGLGLEEGLAQHVEAAAEEGVPVMEAGEHVEVLEYAEGAGPDPHFWTDPAQMILVVDALAPALAELAGDEEAEVLAAAASYREDLSALDEQMAESLSEIPAEHRALVTNHHVFGYLARRYDVTLLGAAIPGGTTLAAPSPADLQELVDAIDTAGVRTIFAESSQPDRLVQVLAEEADREVAVVELITESLAPPGEPGDTYLDMMHVNTERITTGLSP
ncbi:metal ABC transporter substrate-binding protein [Microbacterium murale]|uniref:Zinc/manganese transport system substrate-binding protein n=1 Tax=Microbacterium murale TaxID=1081040 RepID=A0ABU0P6A5_9MICO|nr:metal ABC transporter substrate-binding protein [Microbacterium murale]MDQ0642850.1 zinc/manganese transport system substrate-binding protein [Microbacterium murale]